jgi:predicted HicB family RNase H-like nuclease
MNENRSSISNARSYAEIGQFWDEHDLGDFDEQTRPVEFEVKVQTSSKVYVPLERDLAAFLRREAATEGVSTETLLNHWLKETIEQKALDK